VEHRVIVKANIQLYQAGSSGNINVGDRAIQMTSHACKAVSGKIQATALDESFIFKAWQHCTPCCSQIALSWRCCHVRMGTRPGDGFRNPQQCPACSSGFHVVSSFHHLGSVDLWALHLWTVACAWWPSPGLGAEPLVGAFFPDLVRRLPPASAHNSYPETLAALCIQFWLASGPAVGGTIVTAKHDSRVLWVAVFGQGRPWWLQQSTIVFNLPISSALL